jgi:N12 class adenine-specific DNA methylase
MAKYENIRALAKKQLQAVTESSDRWKAFLRTAAIAYNYSFPNQLLIHEQSPTATAVADIAYWNNNAGRWVKRGAHGIAVFDTRANSSRLRYLFDISDTIPHAEIPEALPWVITDQNWRPVWDKIVADNHADSIQSALLMLSTSCVAQRSAMFTTALGKAIDGSSLQWAKPDEQRQLFIQLITQSCLYMAALRCGVDTARLDLSALESVNQFDTNRIALCLGSACQQAARPLMQQIGSITREIDSVARAEKVRYYGDKQEETNNTKEVNNGVHDGERLPNPGADVERAADAGNREVRQPAAEIPAGERPDDVRRDDAGGNAVPASGGDGQRSTSANRTDDADADAAEHRPEPADRPDGLDAVDERLAGPSRGTGDAADLQPVTQEPQAESDTTPSAFSVPISDLPPLSDELILGLLAKESSSRADNAAILEYFNEHPDLAERSAFCKHCYKQIYTYLFVDDHTVGFIRHDMYLELWEGNYLTKTAQVNLTWDAVAAKIADLIEQRLRLLVYNDQYLTDAEKAPYQAWAAEQQAARAANDAALDHAKHAITDFCENEGLNEPNFSDLTRVEFAYSTTEDDEHEIQVYANLLRNEIRYEVDGNIVHIDYFQDNHELAAQGIENSAFSDFINTAEAEFEKHHPTTRKVEKSPVTIGSTVYLEDDRPFTVEEIGRENIHLRDESFPLVGRAVSHEEFARLLAANPKNAALSAPEVPSRQVQQEETAEPIVGEVIEEPSPFVEQVMADAERLSAEDEPYHREPITYEAPYLDNLPTAPREKFAANIAAIQKLKEIEQRVANGGSPAFEDEQKILAQYTGWGGLSDAFDPNKSTWSNEYSQLKAALSESEYEAARSSTLTAFYTPATVIHPIYRALERFGVKGGKILEPSMGTGAFLAHGHFGSSDAKFYGVELDSITGRISKQLYQKANIQVTGYENALLPDNYFDCVMGNVPFGNFQVNDPQYNRLHFPIHDYFFAKSIDKLRTGGIMAIITSSGTLDKKDDRARKYIAERCDLIGAVRLPNNAFKGSGTKIMTDVIFLQKRDTLRQQDEPWLHLAEDANGITMNRYFVEHPEMICGRMEIVSGPYGPASTCQPIDPDAVDRFGKPLLETQIDTAMQHLTATLTKAEIPIQEESGEDTKYIDADPFVRNFSYTVKDDKIYYREGAVMRECNPNAASAERIRKLVELRDTTRALIDAQLQDLSDEEIHRLQGQLNRQYDAFRAKHGLINSRSAELSFRDDSSYYLLCSLENVDEKGNFISKSDMFTKRTIRSAQIPDHADTASDALALSIGERAKVDMPYMMHLTGKDEATLAKELAGVIFVEPFRKQEDGSPVYLMADEYLSGNVREKLRIAHVAADQDPAFRINVEALEQVQPKDLTAGEITVRLGVTWIGPEIIKRFADELFQSTYREQKIAVRYNEYLNNWYISNKSQGNDNIRVTNTYGTKRINGYHLLENALNLRATKIYDTIYDENGKEQHKLNGPATEEAQAKQRTIEDAFKDWIFKDRERRESLVALYNEKFNCIRPREYDGSHIQFFGMNPEIALRPHQRNAIAHILYGHNTLLAHTVGAGKTYEMVAAAMEKKRLGLCSKTLVAVPNHLTGQFASEALKLYPNANILVTTQRDFEKSNRKRFCAKIATGNYDIVVIGHSQFEKIPLSDARKAEFIRKQIDELEMQLESMDNSDSRLTVKQLESKKKQLKTKLSNLLDAPKRDDVVTFEELGADSLMVDEAHNFKNLMTVTKMHNIAGISTTESQKASDLFMKCQYLDEITGARGVTFATGTPISNSMTELYTMQRYLQQYTLERNGLANFDSWAATFGETVTAIELAPEGTGYRTKTRFARFFNLPELMAMFKECADIQTADMLKLPVPALVGGKPTNIQLKPSEIQKQMVTELGERADKIRNKMVKPYEDNMLKITNDGRKLALDQRLIDPDLPDDPDSKVNICVGKIFEIWEQTMPQRSAQLVFCDLSTPKAGVFNVYDDMKAKLIERGIPETEIAFIHEANTDARKTELFGKVRSGAVRVLMGSTAKMGAGTNVQQRLVALHHLDVPWRPSDIEQREGRILRQGNENKEVYVFRYVTEGTFDAYSWQLIENKQKFIGQIMTSKSPARSCDDMDEAALSYAEVKALAAGNPLIKEKMDLDVQLTRLKTLKAAHDSQRYELENKIAIGFPAEIRKCKEQIENATVDAATVKEHSVVDADGKDVFCIQLEKKVYYEKEPAGKALLGLLGLALNSEKPVPIGYFKGMELQIQHLPFGNGYHARLAGSGTYSTQLGADVLGNLTRLSNLANGIEPSIEKTRNMQIQLEQQLASAEEEVKRPFPQATELTEKSKRLAVLEGLLNMNDKDIVTDTEPEQQCQTDNRQRGQEER